jgi:ABC-type multidrug transport system ATPase subunit
VSHATAPVRPVEQAAPSPRPVAVAIAHLSKWFPERRTWRELLRHPTRGRYVPVLQDVSIDVAEGEFFGLLGPNGAGKTTLFKVLSTLVLPDGGSVEIGGFELARHPERVRGMLALAIADERSLLWRLSARENLALYASLHRLGRKQAYRRADELLELVELVEAGDRMVNQFSSGMKQRLLIARALIPQPRVLLLDEPTRSLDPISARRFRRFLRDELVTRLGCTVLLATHNAEEALELCDRVGILDHGRLLADGSPDALIQQVAGDRYQLWIRPADEPFARTRIERMGARIHSVTPDDEGWSMVQLQVWGGMERAADVLADLTQSGVRVPRFERAKLPLADLIEQVIHQRGAR